MVAADGPTRAAEPPWSPAPALSGARYSAAELSPDGESVFLLDQRALPAREVYVTLDSASAVADAIRAMVVRGAPAIGIAAAYGMALAARGAARHAGDDYLRTLRGAAALLEVARPTAVNLAWAVRRALALAEAHAAKPGATRAVELAE